jgi:uncharacterized membrane protein
MAMIRELAGHQLIPPEKHFRWRGGEITRLEGFTDAVFAFAVTLLIVSLEVPHNFSQLELTMRGFFAFAICFGLLAHLWHLHYLYSRRYGLQTSYSVFLNLVLLFVVLFYVFPLKFMFTLTVGNLFGANRELHSSPIELYQVPVLVVIFTLGYAAVFTIFALLYQYAYSKRRELMLNEYESLRTLHDLISFAVVAGIGVLVAVTAVLLPLRISFFSVFLLPLSVVYALIMKPIFRRREKAALARIATRAAALSGS